MEKNITRKQQIVKNIAIVFLSILLVLTFFSNTIMNMTLPEVMVTEISRGTITTQIHATGIVEARDLYQVMMTESRIVESISVREGQRIQEGDILCYFQGMESEELEVAMEEKERLEYAYNKMVLSNYVTASELQNLITNGITLDQCQAVLATITDQAKYTATLNHYMALIDIYEQYQQIQKQTKQIEQYQALAMGSSIVAPVNGTIVEIALLSGKQAQKDQLAFTILPEGQKLYMEVSLDATVADALTKTTQIQVLSPMALNQTYFALQGVSIDPTTSENRKLVTFEVQGDEVTVGQVFSIGINKKSIQYEMMVSNNAIRKDSSGNYYVLKLNQESSSLGNRYYVEKVVVDIVDKSDMQTAISGALYGDEYLIVDSNRPISNGQQVRLVEE